MKKIKSAIHYMGLEFVLFLVAAIIGIMLIIKTVADFVSAPVIEHRFHLSTPEVTNALLAIGLAHAIHTTHSHYKRKGNHLRMVKGRI